MTRAFHQAIKSLRRLQPTGILQRLFQAKHKISYTVHVQNTVLQVAEDTYREGFVQKVSSDERDVLF